MVSVEYPSGVGHFFIYNLTDVLANIFKFSLLCLVHLRQAALPLISVPTLTPCGPHLKLLPLWSDLEVKAENRQERCHHCWRDYQRSWFNWQSSCTGKGDPEVSSKAGVRIYGVGDSSRGSPGEAGTTVWLKQILKGGVGCSGGGPCRTIGSGVKLARLAAGTETVQGHSSVRRSRQGRPC